MRNIDIYKMFSEKWIKKAGEYYVDIHSSIDFLNFLAENKVAILGVDGFIIDRTKIKAHLSFCFDYSKTESLDAIKNDIKSGFGRLTHYSFIIENKAPEKFFLLCSRQRVVENYQIPETIMMIKTKIANTYLAFTDISLAQKYLEIHKAENRVFVLSNSELHKDILFHFDPGVIVLLKTEDEVRLMLSDTENFPFSDYIVEYRHPFKSTVHPRQI